jgi:hypothetical protein
MLKYSTKYVREWAVGYNNCIHNVDFSVRRANTCKRAKFLTTKPLTKNQLNVGLSDVPDFAGHPRFKPLCPAFRLDPPRDVSRAGFGAMRI